MVNKKINMGKMKGRFKMPDLKYVPLSDIESMNELKLNYEITFAIGLTLLGVLITKLDNLILWIVTIAFLLYGIIFLIRYIMKWHAIKK